MDNKLRGYIVYGDVYGRECSVVLLVAGVILTPAKRPYVFITTVFHQETADLILVGS